MPSNNFRLNISEFKGRVLAELKMLNSGQEEIKEIINEQIRHNRIQHKEFYDRIRRLEQRPSISVNPIQWLKSLLGL